MDFLVLGTSSLEGSNVKQILFFAALCHRSVVLPLSPYFLWTYSPNRFINYFSCKNLQQSICGVSHMDRVDSQLQLFTLDMSQLMSAYR